MRRPRHDHAVGVDVWHGPAPVPSQCKPAAGALTEHSFTKADGIGRPGQQRLVQEEEQHGHIIGGGHMQSTHRDSLLGNRGRLLVHLIRILGKGKVDHQQGAAQQDARQACASCTHTVGCSPQPDCVGVASSHTLPHINKQRSRALTVGALLICCKTGPAVTCAEKRHPEGGTWFSCPRPSGQRTRTPKHIAYS